MKRKLKPAENSRNEEVLIRERVSWSKSSCVDGLMSDKFCEVKSPVCTSVCLRSAHFWPKIANQLSFQMRLQNP